MSDPTPRRFADLLGGLLGPAGPELTCEECFDHLDRYVELELSGRDADTAVPGMHAHLEGLPRLRRGPRQPPRARPIRQTAAPTVTPRPR